jgi:hypothetical protein
VAKKGSSKALSVDHEDHIAKSYRGRRSPSSGASDTDAGDVRTQYTLFECKLTGSPGKLCEEHERIDCKDCMKTPTLVRHMEKVAHEAYAEERWPAVALRFYAPHSTLANPQGWVDMTVRMTHEDKYRDPDE